MLDLDKQMINVVDRISLHALHNKDQGLMALVLELVILLQKQAEKELQDAINRAIEKQAHQTK